MQYRYGEYVPLMKALADETRLRILDMLSCGELCACDLLEHLNITQPTLSYHMKMLTACQLVEARKEGIWMKYQLNEVKVKDYTYFVTTLLAPKEDCICKNLINKF